MIFVRKPLLAFLALLCATHLMGKEARTLAEVIPITDCKKLEPGKFEWDPSRSANGDLTITVILSLQMVDVYRGGILIARSSVCTGRNGHRTPCGSFNILGKEAIHYSTLYDSAPMPFMLRLTWDGVALHSGVIGSRPSSHGCVRLPREFAKRLFQTAKCGDMVTIVSDEQSMPDPTLPRNPEPPKIEVKQTAKLPPPAKVAVTASTNSPTVPQPVKTMAQLERDERGIREDNSLTQAARMQKLRDVWAQQLQLMKSH